MCASVGTKYSFIYIYKSFNPLHEFHPKNILATKNGEKKVWNSRKIIAEQENYLVTEYSTSHNMNVEKNDVIRALSLYKLINEPPN